MLTISLTLFIFVKSVSHCKCWSLRVGFVNKPILLRNSWLLNRIKISLKKKCTFGWLNYEHGIDIFIIPPFVSFSNVVSTWSVWCSTFDGHVYLSVVHGTYQKRWEGRTHWHECFHSVCFIFLGGPRIGTLWHRILFRHVHEFFCGLSGMFSLLYNLKRY